MNVETSHTGSTAVAAVSGRVDSANAKEFEEELSAIIDKGATGLVVDCGELNYISSAGLRVLLLVAKDLQKKGAPFAICSLSGQVMELFTVSGFDQIIAIHDTRDLALASFNT